MVFLSSCSPSPLSFGLALTACPSFPFTPSCLPPALCPEGTIGPVTVGWPSVLCLRSWEPAFSSLILALFSWVAQPGSAFLENNSELCSAKSSFPKRWYLLTGPPPSSCSQLLTTSYARCSLLPLFLHLLEGRHQGPRQMEHRRSCCGRGLRSEFMPGSCGKGVCMPFFFFNQWARKHEQDSSTKAYSCFIFFTLLVACKIVRIKKINKASCEQLKRKEKSEKRKAFIFGTSEFWNCFWLSRSCSLGCSCSQELCLYSLRGLSAFWIL